MSPNDSQLLSALADRLRALRHQHDFSLTQLAESTQLSRRYLTELEAGRANISILKLARLATALKTPLADLCDLPLTRAPRRRIALVGLRGAGKSTVGRLLALELDCPFVELDRLIEERSGLSLDQIFSIHGPDYYRQLEAESLEHYLSRNGEGVLATGGSIATHPENYNRLLTSCHTIYLSATPEDHWHRVIAQGDTRPMATNPRAMDQLRTILQTRHPAYSRAHIKVTTTNKTPIDVVADLKSQID